MCQIVPLDAPSSARPPLEEDGLYRAGPVGRSRDGRSSADHDELLYGRRRR